MLHNLSGLTPRTSSTLAHEPNSIKDLAARSNRLIAPVYHQGSRPQPIHFSEPLPKIDLGGVSFDLIWLLMPRTRVGHRIFSPLCRKPATSTRGLIIAISGYVYSRISIQQTCNPHTKRTDNAL